MINGAQIIKTVLERKEYIEKKKKPKNFWDQHFLLVPQCFQKLSFSVLLIHT